MQETCTNLNSTLHSTELVVKLLQQLVTESTDQVLATQPCIFYTHTHTHPTGYRVYRPSPFNSLLPLGFWLQRNNLQDRLTRLPLIGLVTEKSQIKYLQRESWPVRKLAGYSSCLNSLITPACWFLPVTEETLAYYRELVDHRESASYIKWAGYTQKKKKKKNVSPSSASSRDVFRTVEPSTTGYRVGVATEELQY